MQMSCLNTHTHICLFIGHESFNLKQFFNRMVFTYVNIIAYDFSPKIFFWDYGISHAIVSTYGLQKNMLCAYDTYLSYSYILL